MNYRKLYIKKIGEIPSDWEVHHIDGNRQNNSIKNLVALPIKLHKRLHTRQAMYFRARDLITNLYYVTSNEKKYYIENFHAYLDVRNEVYEYIILRNSKCNL